MLSRAPPLHSAVDKSQQSDSVKQGLQNCTSLLETEFVSMPQSATIFNFVPLTIGGSAAMSALYNYFAETRRFSSKSLKPVIMLPYASMQASLHFT